jgi:hypothetical protein
MMGPEPRGWCLIKDTSAKYGETMYFVSTLKGFLSMNSMKNYRDPKPSGDNYVLIAKHHDKEVLIKMRQLAIEGEMERKD